MVKHTQTICLSVFDHFMNLALKGLSVLYMLCSDMGLINYTYIMNNTPFKAGEGNNLQLIYFVKQIIGKTSSTIKN